jgi:mannose-6-phosphate isomerase-like protein (cupin superfamily)
MDGGGTMMADNTINPFEKYLLMEPDGKVVVLPGGGDFWSQMMSGNPTDPGIQRLMGSDKGRLLSVLSMSADWTNWEMHPAGDEILYMIEGEVTFVLDLTAGLTEVRLATGRLMIIRQGVWHTGKLNAPGRLLAITPGLGTQHRPV